MYAGPDRRNERGDEGRPGRIRAGGLSSTLGAPVAVLIVYGLQVGLGMTFPEYVIIAIAAVIGSMTTWTTMCARDARHLLYALLIGRRKEDGFLRLKSKKR